MGILQRFLKRFWYEPDQKIELPPSIRSMSPKLFDLPASLIEELRAAESSRLYPDPESADPDIFLLDPGMGPETWLTSDGRIVWKYFEPIEATPQSVYPAIVVGAMKTGVPGLLNLLPKRSADATDCDHCDGSGWFSAHGELKDVHGEPSAFVCLECSGLGWLPTPPLTAR